MASDSANVGGFGIGLGVFLALALPERRGIGAVKARRTCHIQSGRVVGGGLIAGEFGAHFQRDPLGQRGVAEFGGIGADNADSFREGFEVRAGDGEGTDRVEVATAGALDGILPGAVVARRSGCSAMSIEFRVPCSIASICEWRCRQCRRKNCCALGRLQI